MTASFQISEISLFQKLMLKHFLPTALLSRELIQSFAYSLELLVGVP
jgi:hypothetical protein